MLFNSFEFLCLFLPCVFILFRLLVKKKYSYGILFLVISSLVFYGWWNPRYLLLFIGSITTNFLIGRVVQNQNLSQSSRKFSLITGVLLNLLFLGYYKYLNFFAVNLNLLFGTEFQVHKTLLPLAISFFTFQQITYLVDSYKNEVDKHSFIYYCLYVSFFPQLIAGPIVHHKEVLPQFKNKKPATFSYDNIANGLIIFIVGLGKKVVLADSLSVYSNSVFDASTTESALSMSEAWVGALSYSFQLYFDFSGYSDMATGIALIFGIILPLNFNAPYRAQNIIEFWRRWHITLSRFLRDYLYIPLGGNRHGAFNRYRNLFLTMLLGGIWHGAGWTFIMWGALHGFYLCVNHLWIHIKAQQGLSGPPTIFSRIFSQVTTFFFVVVGWVFFKATNFTSAVSILKSMLGFNGFQISSRPDLAPYKAYLLIALSLAIIWFAPTVYEYLQMRQYSSKVVQAPQKYSMATIVALVIITITSLLFLLTIQKAEFLYYDF